MTNSLELWETVQEAIRTNREDVVNYLRHLEDSIENAVIVKAVIMGDPLNKVTEEQLFFMQYLANFIKEELGE